MEKGREKKGKRKRKRIKLCGRKRGQGRRGGVVLFVEGQ